MTTVVIEAPATISRRWRVAHRLRRLFYLATAIVLAFLVFFPRPEVARAKLLPQDSSSAGLGQILNSLGGQLSNFASLLNGGRPPNDLYLVIGRSDGVQADVIGKLRLAGPGRRWPDVTTAKRALAKRVDVRLLLGGVLEVETRTRDAAEAEALTGAYVQAISDRIGALGRQTITRKRQIVEGRFREAGQRVAQTQGALDAFRRRNRLAAPEEQLGSEISLRAQLQGQLQAKLVELQSVRQFAGPDNPQLAAVQAQIASIQSQIARTGEARIGAAGPNVGGLSELSSRYLNLYRDYRFAQALYDVYARAAEQTSVESLVAESASYIQIVEPPHVDAERHYNVLPLGLLGAVMLLALFTELYVPMTGLRWPDLAGRSDADARDA